MRKLLLLIIFLLSYNWTYSQSDSAKTEFHLFKPTPKILMRGFETDRPDITESAYTVDAGHFQLETDFFKLEKNDAINQKTSYYNFINLKLGISNSTDLQLVISSFEVKKVGNIKDKGFGGVSVRLKQNLWGNDMGKTALAIMPFINLPKSNEKTTGGLILPFAMALPNNWGFGAQLQTDFVDNQLGDKYHINYLASATIGHQLFKDTNFFIESYISQETEIKQFEYFFNGGIIYELGEHIKLDTGFNYGFKSISNKVIFLGFSFRY